jgi:predicted nucleic acid-binding protein
LKWFFDTSVLIPALLEDHQHHQRSFAAFSAAERNHACCAAHSLAEIYTPITRLPEKHRLSGDQVLLFLEAIEERLTLVALTDTEYLAAIRKASADGVVAGMLYDALLATCGLKAKAEFIYTWDVQHFRRLGPEVDKRIRTP